jgi:hypothetical protein
VPWTYPTAQILSEVKVDVEHICSSLFGEIDNDKGWFGSLRHASDG